MMCPNCGTYNLPGNEVCSNCHQDLTPLDLPTPQNEIERSLMEDPVAVLPPHPPVLVTADTPVAEAVRAMLSRNVGAVLVVNAEGLLVGIFTERDVLKKLGDQFYETEEVAVSRFMSPNPETISPAEPLNFALHKMDVGGYRHLPVVVNGRPVGMVSVRDMLRHMTRLGQ